MSGSLTLREAIRNKTHPLIGAHRGFSKTHTENTMSAFAEAVQLGADFLELDVRLSLDEIPVVIHDETIDRTTTGHGYVHELTCEELREQGSIPALHEILTAFGQLVFLNIELKSGHNDDRLTDAVLKLVLAHALQDRVIISSFQHDLLYRLRQANGRILTGVLFEEQLPEAAMYAKRLGADALHPHYRFLNRKLATACQAANLLTFPWTVDQACSMNYLAKIGVTGIITNRTDAAVQVLCHR